MPQIEGEDFNIKTMLLPTLPQFDYSHISYWDSILSDLAHYQPDKNVSVFDPQTLQTSTKFAVAEELVPQASALDKRGRPIGKQEITLYKEALMRETLPVDQWLHSQMHNTPAHLIAKRVLLQSC